MMWSRLLHDPLGFLWQAVQTRGVRMTFYLLLTAALFPSARLILLAVLLVTLAVMWTRAYRSYGSRNIIYLAVALGVLVVGYGPAWMDVTRVEELRLAKSPWGAGIKLVDDGSYLGEGPGFRGPIKVRVNVDKHRIAAIEMLEYPDLISVKDNEIARLKQQILAAGMLERPAHLPMLRGAGQTMTGYFNAIESALTKGIPDYPQYGAFARVYLGAVIGRAPDRVTLNALAILFAVFVVFEYALQSMLTPGTGRSINCYNCASCVGACPVKEVDGISMPMGLILLTRLGDYERVKELSKYCVGCGRCAIKCPIGNSGPLVISAAYQAARKQEAELELLKQGDEA
jgi:uncharacterized protein with FMN-binding domain/ferredoxin